MPRRDSGKAAVAWAAIDMLGCLFLILLVLIQPPAKPPTIETLGVYAVTISWKNGSNDDVDLYVKDPKGNTCYFVNSSTGLMHLEHDDLGTHASESEGETVVRQNAERVILRGTTAGEYIVNVHMYRKSDPGAMPVTVELWRLKGNDKALISKRVVLVRQGQALTPFRFTLNAKGNMVGQSDLPRNIVAGAPVDTSNMGSDRNSGNYTQSPSYYYEHGGAGTGP